MARLIFLFADTGGGHRAAATAVAREVEAMRPGAHAVRVVDPFTVADPGLLGRTAGLYGPITRHARWLWGGLWHATNSRTAVSLLMNSVMRLATPAIAREFDSFTPDAVVSFHPLLNHPAVRAARRRGSAPPVATVITDLVDVHASWACPDVDAVIVPSPGGFERCRRAGIPAERCHDIGLAVDASFTAPPPDAVAKRDLRQRLGLREEGFLVLVCGGADGSGGIARRATALATSGLDVEVAVICGRNTSARRRLRDLHDARGRTVRVEGFVSNMADWMRAADVLVSKAGPGTIAEALCCGVPLLLTSYLPGQERGNVDWVADVGAGRYVPRVGQLIDAVAELSQPGSPHLEAMRTIVRQVARPEAAARIAALVEGLALRARAAQ